jgi:anti-sigma regulatory factor (Ser/Thr protein kinase)
MTKDMGALKVPGDLQSIAEIRQWLEELLLRVPASQEAIFDVLSAVTEICSNIVRHGYTPEISGDIQLEAVFGSNTFELKITDTAPAFVPEGGASLPDHRLAEGGYGAFLADSLMDQVVYEPLGKTGNRTTLVKRIAPSPEGPDQDGEV